MSVPVQVARTRAHDVRAGGQPAESQTRRDTFFLTEELAIDYEALPADGNLPRERTCMSGRGRAGEGAAPAGLCNGSPWLQPRAKVVGRARGHMRRGQVESRKTAQIRQMGLR